MAKFHHDIDIYPVPKDRAPIYVNEPWLLDGSIVEGYPGGVIASEDNIRIYVPIDINKDAILLRLKTIINKYSEANESNEFDFDTEVRKLVYQIEIYDQIYTAQNSLDGSKKVIDLVEEFIEILRQVPDSCAEIFPFGLIEELENEYK